MVQSELVADTVNTSVTSNGKEANILPVGNEVSISRTIRNWPHQQHVALCYASRGVGHMPSVFSAWRELEATKVQYTLCPAFYQPIPEAQNEVTRLALDSGADVLWFVEDDILLPVGVLDAMLTEHAHGAKVVTVDYSGRDAHGSFIVRDRDGRVMLTPMGCLLVDRSVFNALPNPPWQVDTVYRAMPNGTWLNTGAISHIGQQDVFFSRNCWDKGIPITELKGWQVGHLDVKEHGGRNNYGTDVVHCYGGTGELQWKPSGLVPWRKHKTRISLKDGVIVADDEEKVIYIMSEKGTVLDMQESKARMYLKRNWKPISKTQFEAQLKKQNAHRQERIEQQRADIADMDKPS